MARRALIPMDRHVSFPAPGDTQIIRGSAWRRLIRMLTKTTMVSCSDENHYGVGVSWNRRCPDFNLETEKRIKEKVAFPETPWLH
jgi:hypothetical protein